MSKNLFLIFVLIVIAFSITVCFFRASGEIHSKKMYEAHQQADWNTMAEEADLAENCCYKIDPMSIPIEWYKGVALFAQNDIEQSKICFEKAYTIAPYNIHVLNNLASSYERLGNHRQAIELYLKSIQINSTFEESLLNLSGAYFNSGDFEKAFSTISRCDTNSEDAKYKVFLPAILKAKTELLIKFSNNNLAQNELNKIKNQPQLLQDLFLKSKKNRITFDSLINQQLKYN